MKETAGTHLGAYQVESASNSAAHLPRNPQQHLAPNREKVGSDTGEKLLDSSSREVAGNTALIRKIRGRKISNSKSLSIVKNNRAKFPAKAQTSCNKFCTY